LHGHIRTRFDCDLRTGLCILPSSATCPGDCDSDGSVTIDELIECVNVALEFVEPSTCLACDVNDDGAVTVDDLITAVTYALSGCSGT
jgi:hypothetical protein